MRKYQLGMMFFFLIGGLASNILGQGYSNRSGGRPGQMSAMGSVSGFIFDEENGKPISYATVAVYSHLDSTLITGGICDEDGFFEIKKIKYGKYYLQIQMVGYKKGVTREFQISAEKQAVNFEKIYLSQMLTQLKGINVSADRPAIEYKIDKKVINVAKHYTATSGSAVEVLENVPSVEVDFLGNVSLRGSSNFQVLIDGRPSILDASDALQQIPASAIENIEIITNPSAKFDPDGTSGIINILMKKNKLSGLSGNVSMNLGEDERYGGNVLLNYRNSKYNAYISFDYNNRPHPGTTVSNHARLGSHQYQYTHPF